MSDNVTPATSEPSSGWRHALVPLAGLYLLAIIWGLRSLYADRPSPLDFIAPWSWGACASTWAVFDARRRRHPIPQAAQIWFFLLASVMVPGYVIGSRGWRGFAWLLMHVFLWYMLAALTMIIGWIVLNEALQLRM